MFDPPVHVHKTVFMQRVLDAVSHGYHWHTSGTVPLDKAQRLAEKFGERYEIDRNQNQRAYAKRKGQSNARFFLYASPKATSLTWFLLVTDGDGCIHQEERLRHAQDARGRIRLDEDYELIRRTRKSDKGGGTVWSWRMTKDCERRWRERIILACRQSHTLAVTQTIGSLYRVPGFSGIREQTGALVALTRSEWRRRHGTLDALLTPPKLPYIERMADTAVPLSEYLINRVGDRSFIHTKARGKKIL